MGHVGVRHVTHHAGRQLRPLRRHEASPGQRASAADRRGLWGGRPAAREASRTSRSPYAVAPREGDARPRGSSAAPRRRRTRVLGIRDRRDAASRFLAGRGLGPLPIGRVRRDSIGAWKRGGSIISYAVFCLKKKKKCAEAALLGEE